MGAVLATAAKRLRKTILSVLITRAIPVPARFTISEKLHYIDG